MASTGESVKVEDAGCMVPVELPISSLHGATAFDKLEEKEKLYAGYLMLAAYAGYPIVVKQNYEHSYEIFELVKDVYSIGFPEVKRLVLECGSEEDYNALLNYFVKFLYETGNYDSFGDKKFIPSLPEEKMNAIFKQFDTVKRGIYDKYLALSEHIYSLEASLRVIGLPPNSKSIYYEGLNAEEIEAVHSFQQGKIGYENTMITKEMKDGKTHIVINVASIQKYEKIIGYENDYVFVERGGLFAEELTRSVKWLNEAKKYALNETQKQMLEELIEHYTTGELDKHIEYSKTWVKDINPNVEMHAGFIETYRDPKGVRAEFEQFVAVKDKDSTAILVDLVANAENIIPRLPWGKDLENTAFKAPDFTGIDIVAFVTNGLPIGINIPNYDCIRHEIGFKNVSLQNVMRASNTDPSTKKEGAPVESLRFIKLDDSILYRKHESQTLDLHVALHELYGHGSGKLLNKEDVEDLIKKGIKNCATGDDFMITTPTGARLYYDKEDAAQSNYNNVFGDIASSWEECRAEAVALYLSTDPYVQTIFKVKEEDRAEFNRVSWLMYLQMGLTSLMAYNKYSHKWMQAHCLARFMIMKWMVSACPSAIFITECTNPQDGGKTGYYIDVDMSKLESHLRPALATMLCKLTGFKATADILSAREFVATYGAVDSRYLVLLDCTEKTKKPRRIYLQPAVEPVEGGVHVFDRTETPENYIQTVLDNCEAASK